MPLSLRFLPFDVIATVTVTIIVMIFILVSLLLVLVLTTLLGLTICPKGLDTSGTLDPMLGVLPLQLRWLETVFHFPLQLNFMKGLLVCSKILLLLVDSRCCNAWVLLSPPIACRGTRPTV